MKVEKMNRDEDDGTYMMKTGRDGRERHMDDER